MQLDAQKIRKKIIAVGKIKKITRSMSIVAGMKISKLRKNSETIQMFIKIFSRFYDGLFMTTNFSIPPTKGPTTWIILTTDLGLCGSYNAQIFSTLSREKKNNDKLIIIGRKGINYFSAIDQKNIWTSTNEEFKWNKINELVDFLLIRLKNNFGPIRVISGEYTTGSKLQIIIWQLLPFDIVQADKNPPKSLAPGQIVLIEPNFFQVYQKSLSIYLQYFFYYLLINGRAAEEHARVVAMENAAQNANDLVLELKLQYNQQRQEKITREILTVTQI